MAGAFHFAIPDLGRVERPYTCGCGVPLQQPGECATCRVSREHRETQAAYRKAGEYVPGSYRGNVGIRMCDRCGAKKPCRKEPRLGNYVFLCKPCNDGYLAEERAAEPPAPNHHCPDCQKAVPRAGRCWRCRRAWVRATKGY